MTKLEREHPDIAEMVKQLGGRIIYRPGGRRDPGYYRLLMGGSDWQLTGYQYNKDNRPMSDADNIEAAKIKLRGAIEARSKWGTLRERGRHILNGVREQVKNYLPQHYNNFFDISGDSGTIFASEYPRIARDIGITRTEWENGQENRSHTVWIELIGLEQMKFEGPNFEAAIKNASEWVENLDLLVDAVMTSHDHPH